MSCYKITIGTDTFTLYDNTITEEAIGNSEEAFYNTLLNYAKSTDPTRKEVFRLFTETLSKVNTAENISSFDDSRFANLILESQNPDLPYIIQANLKSLGVHMKVCTSEEFKTEGLDPDATAAVKDGIIYCNSSKFTVTAPLHELLHLIFGVMKVKEESFDSYRKVIKSLVLHPRALQILENLKVFKAYSTTFELDKEEEAVIRLLEEMVTKPNFDMNIVIDGIITDIPLFLDLQMSKSISEIFGITKYPGIITFMKSVIADIPVFGSKLFIPTKIESLGFKQYLQEAVKSALISDYIKQLSSGKNPEIIKGNCI